MTKTLSLFKSAAVLCAVVSSHTPSSVFADITKFINDQDGFNAMVVISESEEEGDFGADPTAAVVASLTRTGSQFSYTVENRDTLAVPSNMDLLNAADGKISDLYFDTNALLEIEAIAEQDAATTGNFGVDSRGGGAGSGNSNSSGGIASRNAAVFSFGGPISAFNINLLDFEASLGQEGLLVLGNDGDIVHSEDLNFNDGNGEVTNFGITGSNSWKFDQAIFILGDDNDSDTSNGYGGTEFWATADAIIGSVVPEPNSAALAGIAGMLLGLTRRKS
jgi:hypothetical protein